MRARQKSGEPRLATVIHKSRTKKRFARVDDAELILVLQAAGRPLAGDPRAWTGASGSPLVGIFVLPTNNIMELYASPGRPPIAFVFTSIDVWMSFGPEDLAVSA